MRFHSFAFPAIVVGGNFVQLKFLIQEPDLRPMNLNPKGKHKSDAKSPPRAEYNGRVEQLVGEIQHEATDGFLKCYFAASDKEPYGTYTFSSKTKGTPSINPVSYKQSTWGSSTMEENLAKLFVWSYSAHDWIPELDVPQRRVARKFCNVMAHMHWEKVKRGCRLDKENEDACAEKFLVAPEIIVPKTARIKKHVKKVSFGDD